MKILYNGTINYIVFYTTEAHILIKNFTANKKLLIRVLICFAVVLIAGISAVVLKHFVSNPDLQTESTTIVTKTEIVPVTDNSGEFVTDENGEQVFDKITVTKPQPVSTTEKQAFLDKLFNKNDSKTTTENNPTDSETSDSEHTTEPSATNPATDENTDSTSSPDNPSEEASTQVQTDTSKPVTTTDSVETTAPKESNGFTYTIVNGAVKLLSYNGNDSVVTVPSEIDGKKVSYLGSNVFSSKSNITSIVFEGSSSGSEKFYLPANTTVFNSLSNLTSVTFPFETNNYFVNGDGSTSYSYSFGTLFSSCPKISSVSFGEYINSMYSPTMSRMFSIDGVVFVNTSSEISLIWYPIAKSQADYTMPDNVRKIEKNAFFNNNYVESITLSSKVRSVATPNFRSCSKLSSFSVAEGNTSFTATNGVLYYSSSFTSNNISFLNAFYPAAKTDTSFTFPADKPISFDANTFCGNPYLKEITIPENSRIDGAMLSSDSRPLNLEKIRASKTCLLPASTENIYTIEYYD